MRSRRAWAAAAGDVVVIAGKGREQGQEVAGRIVPFDDREVAREALRRLDGGVIPLTLAEVRHGSAPGSLEPEHLDPDAPVSGVTIDSRHA